MAGDERRLPPSRGFFVAREVVVDDLGVRTNRAPAPKDNRRTEPPPSQVTERPDTTAVNRTARRELPMRRDDRAEGGRAPAEEVAFGSVVAQRAPAAPPPPPPRSVEVQRTTRVTKLLDELGRCGPGAESIFLGTVRGLDEAGLALLAGGFPGLLWFDRRLPHQREPRGRDVSPIASLFAQVYPASQAAVVSLLGHEDADIRYYAMLLADDLGDPALLPAVSARAFDTDTATVRRALGFVQRVGGGPALEALGAELATVLVGFGNGWARKVRAIEVLTALRHPLGLEALVKTLDEPDATLQANAARALLALTARAFGGRSRDWAKFVEKNRGRSRLEWLLDALVDEEGERRDLAATELAALTGRDAGYVKGGDKKQAKAARAVWEKAARR